MQQQTRQTHSLLVCSYSIGKKYKINKINKLYGVLQGDKSYEEEKEQKREVRRTIGPCNFNFK